MRLVHTRNKKDWVNWQFEGELQSNADAEETRRGSATLILAGVLAALSRQKGSLVHPSQPPPSTVHHKAGRGNRRPEGVAKLSCAACRQLTSRDSDCSLGAERARADEAVLCSWAPNRKQRRWQPGCAVRIRTADQDTLPRAVADTCARIVGGGRWFWVACWNTAGVRSGVRPETCAGQSGRLEQAFPWRVQAEATAQGCLLVANNSPRQLKPQLFGDPPRRSPFLIRNGKRRQEDHMQRAWPLLPLRRCTPSCVCARNADVLEAVHVQFQLAR